MGYIMHFIIIIIIIIIILREIEGKVIYILDRTLWQQLKRVLLHKMN